MRPDRIKGRAILVALLFCALIQPMSKKPAIGQTVAEPSQGDPRRGRIQFVQCAACHALTPDDQGKIGPSLHGLFGRPAGSLADANYSAALAKAEFIWTAERIDAYIAAPAAWLPGTSMAFDGIADASRRADLIAYLREATAPAEQLR